MRYAGFWKRLWAYSVDVLIVQLIAALIFWAFGDGEAVKNELYAILQLASQDVLMAQQRLHALMFSRESLALAFGVPAMYNILFVASRWQATPGKHWYRMQIVARGGGRPSFVQAIIRHLACGLSWATAGIGFAMIGLDKEKAALHDVIAGTRVVYTEEAV